MGIAPISTIRSRTETVQHGVVTGTVQLEYRASLVRSTCRRSAIKVAFSVLDQPCLGICPVGTIRSRTELVKHGVLSRAVQLEDRAILIRSADISSAIQVAGRVQEQADCGIVSIGTIRSRTETVQHSVV